MDNRGVGQYDLSALCAVLAKEYEWASKLNSQARQASAERAWQSIKRFYDNCKNPLIKKKGYPKFKKSRSVEYKTTGYKLSKSTSYFAPKQAWFLNQLIYCHDNLLQKSP